MTEERQLLLQDLCARSLYGVVVEIRGSYEDGEKYIRESEFDHSMIGYVYDEDVSIKPYLRPMSSMTEEEKRELHGRYNVCLDEILNTLILREHSKGYWDEDTECSFVDYLWFIDWLNAHHFDYRGLIEKGLALEAPDGMYK